MQSPCITAKRNQMGDYTFNEVVIRDVYMTPQPLPDRFKEGYPDTGNDEQNKFFCCVWWNAFFQEFVSDIRSESSKRIPHSEKAIAINRLSK